MLFPYEIQLSLSESINDIDIEDLKYNTNYIGYDASDSYIKEFFNHLASLPN